MIRIILTAAAIAAFASPLAAQDVTGQTQAASAVKVNVTAKPSLAATAKVSADSAFAIARAAADNGEVSSAKLETDDGRLVYRIQVLNKSKRETEVVVNAMNGRVVSKEQHGGLKSTVLHAKENKKLLNAKRDSAAKAP
jgi:uncharacterized membrane protein YkoI